MATFSSFFYLLFIMVALAITASSADLSPTFYDKLCPKALPTIKRVVREAVKKESRMGASLLRLHFHDCFVNGCDGSVLLDVIDSEKNSRGNNNSLRGFEVVDKIKFEVDKICSGPVVSCADILAVAARDSVVALGGPTWKVQLGRRDSTISRKIDADNNLPSPLLDLPALMDNFKKQGLNTRDLVALSGGHTIGKAQCRTFVNRTYNEPTNIDPIFASVLKKICPDPTGGDANLAPLDPTAARFDTKYFSSLLKKRGLLHSDQALYSGGIGKTDELVKSYSSNAGKFSAHFAKSMIKMGNIKPLTGKNGQIRVNCRKVNS